MRTASLAWPGLLGNPQNRYAVRCLCGLALALAAYSGFSMPAPPAIGAAELAVAAGLLLATGLRRPVALALGLRDSAGGAGRVAFAWLLWAPLLTGVMAGHAAPDILRDVVPLGFLFLPLLVGPAAVPLGRCGVRVLASASAIAGVIFSARWLTGVVQAGALGHGHIALGTKYLLNSPLVLFAAVWLPLAAMRLAGRGSGMAVTALVLGTSGVLAFGTLAAEVHRAAVGLGVIAILAWALQAGRRRPLWVLPALAMGFPLLLLWHPGPVDAFMAKTRIQGWNGRWAEVAAVLDLAARDWTALIFGSGWGGLIRNPAVGDWWVSYTHTFPSYLLFKTGLAGCLAAAVWLAGLVPAWLRLVRRDPALGYGLAPALAVGLLFHTSFKYLCFGVLLTVLLQAGAWSATPIACEGRG